MEDTNGYGAEPHQDGARAAELPGDEYAVVEVFGHRKHVGRVMEVERFGAKLLRVDVPNDGDFESGYVSHFYGGSAIFSFTNTDLQSVINANKTWRPPGYKAIAALDYAGQGYQDEEEVDQQEGDVQEAGSESGGEDLAMEHEPRL